MPVAQVVLGFPVRADQQAVPLGRYCILMPRRKKRGHNTETKEREILERGEYQAVGLEACVLINVNTYNKLRHLFVQFTAVFPMW